jgi:hypothetical protein
MNQFTNKADVITGGSNGIGLAAAREPMSSLINILIRFGILKEDLDYHLVRAAMVIIFLFLDIACARASGPSRYCAQNENGVKSSPSR